jgi:predicted extracellular nuclease
MDGTPGLVDLSTLVPPAERYSTHYNGQETLLDYILAAPGLHEDLTPSSVQLLHSSVMSDASDHDPMKARFTLE